MFFCKNTKLIGSHVTVTSKHSPRAFPTLKGKRPGIEIGRQLWRAFCPRLRVVSNFGDGDCHAGEIDTRSPLTSRLLEILCARVCISPAPQSPSPKLETFRRVTLSLKSNFFLISPILISMGKGRGHLALITLFTDKKKLPRTRPIVLQIGKRH